MVEREFHQRDLRHDCSSYITRYLQYCKQYCKLSEFSGSLGDLGTFLPLVVALAATIQLDLGTTLLFTGLYNVLSGIGFRIPMCVQPMKTIAAVALAAPGLTIPEAMSAGIFVSGTMMFLGLTGLMNTFNALIPSSIVRGIQLAVGLQLAKKGIIQALMTAPHSWRPAMGTEGLLLGLLTILFLLVTTVPAVSAAAVAPTHDRRIRNSQQQQRQDANDAEAADCDHHQEQCTQQPAEPSCCSNSISSSSSFPAALVIVLIGIIIVPVTKPSLISSLSLGPSIPTFQVPSVAEFKSGVLKAGLAQLPLTGLNSVIAVSQLAQELFPDRVVSDGWRWRPGAVAVSVGAMNLFGCWWGAFPCCHGSGGLAAQYKFGARAGTSCIMLGLMKITLALLFGSSLLQLLQHFPGPFLGAMLLMSGIELASSARKESDARGYCFMLLTAVAIIGLGDTAVGFAAGLGSYVAVVAADWCRRQMSRIMQDWHSKRGLKGANARGSTSGGGVRYSRLDVDGVHPQAEC